MDKIQKLIDLYDGASERLLLLLMSLEEGTWHHRRTAALYRQVDAILADLTDQAGKQASEILTTSYKAGVSEAVQSIISHGIATELVNDSIMPIIHQQAVQAIVDDTFYSILEASDHMAADIKQRIKETVRLANERSLVRGVSRRSATRQAVAELSQSGITGMVAKNGAKIPADKYMAGVIQYHQRKAHVTGAENLITQNGHDLVYVNFVGITCSYCAKYQGRVYSISGNDSRFPRLEKRPPYHSHCVHSISAWIESYQLAEEVGLMLQRSNRPFEDNRSEHAINRYQERQRDKSRKNEVRKMWIRYKARMPDMPSLRTFAGQKARNTAKYQVWQEDYRRVGEAISKL